MNDLWTQTINGIQQTWKASGKGPIVIMLHGFPQTFRCWDRVRVLLDDQFTVITPALRGYPPGECPGNLDAYRIEELVGDVVGLAKHLSPDLVHLVGHDWGGMIAWHAAAWHPDVFDRLVIIDAPHPDRFLSLALRHPYQFIKSWYIFAFQIPGLAERILTSNPATILDKIFTSSAKRPGTFDAASLDPYRQLFEGPETIRPPLLYYRAAVRDLMTRRIPTLPRIQMATTVLWGRDDHALGTFLTDGLESVVDGEYECLFFDNCGHWAPEEAPGEVAEAIRRRFTPVASG